MLVPQKNKTINWQISWASLLSSSSLERTISIPVCWLLSGKRKVNKKGGNSLLPFKFSHAQWFLEHWTLVSAVVSSLPRWSIAVPPAVKPVPREGRVVRLYMTGEGATCAVKNNKLKINPETFSWICNRAGMPQRSYDICARLFLPLIYIPFTSLGGTCLSGEWFLWKLRTVGFPLGETVTMVTLHNVYGLDSF